MPKRKFNSLLKGLVATLKFRDGVTNKEIARRLNLHRNTVSRWLNRGQVRRGDIIPRAPEVEEFKEEFVRSESIPFLSEATFRQKVRSKNLNAYNSILRGVVNQRWKLNLRQSGRFWNDIRTIKGLHKLKIVTRDGQVRYVMVKESITEWLVNALTTGMVITSTEGFGSDTLTQMDVTDIVELKLIKLEKNKTHSRNGGFFQAFNTTIYDLSKYQIYTEEQAIELRDNNIKRKHCLIHTLEDQGIPSSDLRRIALTIETGSNISHKHLPVIANIIGRDIKIYKHHNSQNVIKSQTKTVKTSVSPKLGPPVHIVCISGHYFTYEVTDISKFSVNNYDKLINHSKTDLDRFNQIRRLKHGNPEYGEGGKVNSFALVSLLTSYNKFKSVQDVSLFLETNKANPTCVDDVNLDNIDKEQRPVELRSLSNSRSSYGRTPILRDNVTNPDAETVTKLVERSERSRASFVPTDQLN